MTVGMGVGVPGHHRAVECIQRITVWRQESSSEVRSLSGVLWKWLSIDALDGRMKVTGSSTEVMYFGGGSKGLLI
jgi:hypothetical protein